MSPLLETLANGSAFGYRSPSAAAGGAFESIATATGNGSSATITFSSIPSTYQHLQIRFIGKSTDSATNTQYNYRLRFNSDTGTNYARHMLNGDGSVAQATGNASVDSIGPGYTPIPNSGASLTNMMGVGIIDIHDYASATKNKTARVFTGTDLNRTTAPTGQVILHSGVWINTNAITSIDLQLTTGSWTTSSSFALYGIKGA
ncbi:hypothetical protein EB077_12120 [bacterium]|nr:hypothetical protein [bacterium]